jgi:hypothetical protein
MTLDPRIELFLHIVGSVCGFGLLGVVFGSLTGSWLHAAGRSAGALGLVLLRMWERAMREPLTPRQRAVIGGGLDGGIFLGVLGGLIGWWSQTSGHGLGWTLMIGGVVAMLAMGAVLFGVVGYFLTDRGVKRSGGVILGAMMGAFVGGIWGGGVVTALALEMGLLLSESDIMFAGLMGGAMLGGGVGAWATIIQGHQ